MSANVDVQIRAARFVCLHVHIEMKFSEHHMTEWTHTLTHSCTIIRAYYRVKHTCCFSLFSTRWCYWWKPCNIHLHQIVADVKRIQFYEQLCLRGNALRASKHLQLPFQTFIHSLICTSDDRQPSPNKLLDQSLASTFGNEPDQALGGVWGEVTRSHVSVTGGTDKPLALYLRGPYKIWGHHHPPESCEPEHPQGLPVDAEAFWSPGGVNLDVLGTSCLVAGVIVGSSAGIETWASSGSRSTFWCKGTSWRIWLRAPNGSSDWYYAGPLHLGPADGRWGQV